MSSSNNRDLAIIAEKEILQKVTIAMRSTAGPKRWFWELLQNAVDTISDFPERKVNVKVTLAAKEDGRGAFMRFEHDGAAFLESKNPNRFDDFKNLILPRSGKLSSDIKKVGKFGTGFLSTHNLSLKIDVDGVYEPLNGPPFRISTTLDRTHFMNDHDRFDTDRINSIIKGLDAYDASIIEKKPVVSENTCFTYHLNDENAVEKVRTGLKDLEQSLPVVLILNTMIGSVDINNELDKIAYKITPCGHTDLGDFCIQSCKKTCGNDETVFSVAYNSNDTVTLCWPVEAYSDGPVVFRDASADYRSTVKDRMPLIYSTFPMIGSHGIKFPMIVHSSSFRPNEKRDGVSLTDETYTDEAEDKEIELDHLNKSLFEDAVSLYGDFLKSAAASAENMFFVAKVNGKPHADWISNDWYSKKVSGPLRKFVATTPIVDVNENKNDRRAILDSEGNIQVLFPSVKIGEGKDDEQRKALNDAFYKFSRDVFGNKIPVREHLEYWDKVLWDDDKVIRVLEISDLLEELASDDLNTVKKLSLHLKLSAAETLEWLNDLYKLMEQTGTSHLCDDYAVVPNQKGVFCLGDELRMEDPESMIGPALICIIRELAPSDDWFDFLVHRSVTECKYPFEKKSLKEHASSRINELLLQNKEDHNIFLKEEKALRVLRRLLSFVSEKESDSNIKLQTFNYCQDVFGRCGHRTIPGYKDFKIDNTINQMIRLINNKIEASRDMTGLSLLLGKDEAATVIWLNEFLNFQIRSKGSEDLIYWADVVPNQYGEFCAHGEEGDSVRMYKPYEIKDGKVSERLSDQLIVNLHAFDPKQDWKAFLVLDGIQLKTLPVKTWTELGAAIDECILKISDRIVNDSDEERDGYRKDLLEVLEWCDWHHIRASQYFKRLTASADRLYSIISFSKDFVSILKNKEKFKVAKKVSESRLSAETIEKTLDKIEEMQDRLGEAVVVEFLNKADTFIEKKEVFNGRLQIGQNIEDLLRSALESENIDILPDKSNAGSYDIGIFRKNAPERILKLEVKSYKFGSSAPFSFSPSQIIDSKRDGSGYIVCTLQRPENENATIDYLKSNLIIQRDVAGLASGFYDKIETFHSIYQESKSKTIPLEIPCVTDPRVNIDHDMVLSGGDGYDELIAEIKKKLN